MSRSSFVATYMREVVRWHHTQGVLGDYLETRGHRNEVHQAMYWLGFMAGRDLYPDTTDYVRRAALIKFFKEGCPEDE